MSGTGSTRPDISLPSASAPAPMASTYSSDQLGGQRESRDSSHSAPASLLPHDLQNRASPSLGVCRSHRRSGNGYRNAFPVPLFAYWYRGSVPAPVLHALSARSEARHDRREVGFAHLPHRLSNSSSLMERRTRAFCRSSSSRDRPVPARAPRRLEKARDRAAQRQPTNPRRRPRRSATAAQPDGSP
jgi:hypothetical protein